MADMITNVKIEILSGRLVFSGELSVAELEHLIHKKSSYDSDAEIMNPEDMQRNTKASCDKEEREELRARLAVNRLKKRYAQEGFVEFAFRELCRRDADFRKIMTDRAFEKVCSVTWNLIQTYEANDRIPEMINIAFDTIMIGSKLEKREKTENTRIH